ncbi:MAG TPA: retroviral-like aspartic protease family protein [Gemmataceae bacterium]|nr:retroviral-like aspartic protease family protein [Gemmataceae bacterium]
MGIFYTDCTVINAARPSKRASIAKMLVDSGSEFTWIPELLLKQAGVKIQKKDVPFQMANGQTISRHTGYAIIQCGAFETVDEVVFAQPGDLSLLGARTLEGFGALVDSRRKRLVAAGPHVVARAKTKTTSFRGK